MDKQWISNEKKKLKKDVEPVGHNLEAVVTVKQYCDEKDEFYVYKVNYRRGNPDKPSFVFKSSREKAKIALNMNRNGSHYPNSEFCYLDGKYKRCRGFVTLTASVYHSLLRKQIIPGTMEAELENSKNVAHFWELFNEILKKVSVNENETLYSVKVQNHKSKPANFISKTTETKRRIDSTVKAGRNLKAFATNFLKVCQKSIMTLLRNVSVRLTRQRRSDRSCKVGYHGGMTEEVSFSVPLR